MKRKLARSERSAVVPLRLPRAAPRARPDPNEHGARKPRSTARRLAAEVEKLAAELAATRTKVAELEARADKWWICHLLGW